MLKKCTTCNKIYNSNFQEDCKNCVKNKNNNSEKTNKRPTTTNYQKKDLMSRILDVRKRRTKQLQHIQQHKEERQKKIFAGLSSETKQEKVIRKQNRKVRKVEVKQKKTELKEYKKQELLQKTKYEDAKKLLSMYETEVVNELKTLNEQREALIKTLEESTDSENLIELQKSLNNLKSEEKIIKDARKQIDDDLKNLKLEINNFNIPKNAKALNVYKNLRKEYFSSAKEQFNEIVKNQLTYNQPKTNDAIEKQINSMKMNQEYLNFWINVSEDNIKPCPGGCVARFSGGKRLFRTVEVAQQNSYTDQYTYIDSPCNRGFHNASRHDFSVNKQIIDKWVVVFELQNQYLELQSIEKSNREGEHTIKLKINNIQKDLFTHNEQNIQLKVNLEEVDSMINNVETKFNIYKENFLNKERRYISTGIFQDNLENDKDL